MASRLDDLLNSVVNRLQSLGVGRTQKPPRQDYSGDRYYGLPERNIVQADRPAYTATPMSMSGGLFGSTQGPVTVADTIRGAIPEPLTPEREAELRRMQEKRLPGEEADLRGINLNPDYDNPFFILPERNSSAVADGTVLAGAGRTGELSAFDTDYANQTAGNPLKIFEPLFSATQGYQDRMTDSERRRKADIEAGTSKRRGLFTSTEEAAAAYKRKKALDDLMQYGGSDMPYQGQAADNATRDAILEYGGGEMPYQGQNIEIDPIVLEIPEQPTNEEVIRTLEQDYADLAAAGADTATLSALAREIDSYRDRQSSLPSIVSEAAASDVIENAPVNYDAFGNVIAQPETEVLMSRQAQIVDPVDDRFTNYIERVEGFKTGKGKTPFRYESPEGGLDTVGLGHKLTQDEIDSNSVYGFDLDTLTKEQAKEIFRRDLTKYEKMLKSDLKTNYKKYKMEQPIDYDTLNQKQKEMLLDFTFNLGSLKGFPKFTEAVLKGDMDAARKEYKRYYKENGKNKEVKDRNEQFFETYLK